MTTCFTLPRTLLSRNRLVWSGIGACLALTLPGGHPSAASAQAPAATEAAAESAIDDGARTIRAWASGGGGLGSSGAAVLAGGTIATRSWGVGMRYSKSMSGGGSSLETYTEHQALLLVHSFGPSAQRSIAIGIGRSKRWEVPYTPCTGDCPLGEQRKGASTTTADGPSLALAAGTRTRPFAGVLALGLELTAFLRKGATSVGLGVAVDIGRL